jgi:hypothetical protein
MNPKFAALVETLAPKLERLLTTPPLPPRGNPPAGGIFC